MRNKLIVVIFLLTLQTMQAQQIRPKPAVKYHSINSIGVLQGESGAAFQWQTVNGVQYNSWFAGVGAGVDYYKYRGIPLFVDVRKEFGSKPDKIFVYGDLGFHFNWLTQKQKDENNYSFAYEFHKGLYTDLGVGYSAKLRKAAFLFSLGYSYKTLNQSKEDYTPAEYPGPPTFSNNHYTMGKITFKVGLKL